MLFNCRSSQVEFLGLLIYTLISSTNKNILTSSLPISMSSVILCLWSPSAVLPKTKTSRTILNKNGQSGELYLVPFFSGHSLSFSHLSWCWQWTHFKLLLMCWVMLPISLFTLGLIMEGSWILSKSISPSRKMIMWFMSFNLYIGLHVPNRYIESFMHFLDEAYMIMVKGVFDMSLA